MPKIYEYGKGKSKSKLIVGKIMMRAYWHGFTESPLADCLFAVVRKKMLTIQ